MTNLRLVLSAIVLLATVAACSSAPTQSSPTQPSPTLVGGLVTTPQQAIAAVVAHDPRFATVGPYRPDLIGQSAWYKVTPASGVGAFVVEIEIGWGDCPAGCIDRHTWTFAVLPDGTVNPQADTGPSVPAEVWPQATGVGQTGIDILATAGPVCPVETPGDPACAPKPVAEAVVVVFDGSGAEVARGVTDASGRWFVTVDAGDYMVRAEPVDGLMGAPQAVATTVTSGSTSSVALGYDTGIR